MAYFARKLRYGAHDGDAGAHYFALLELARKKGGPPIGFVLYRRIMFPAESRTEMIRLSAGTAEEAIRRFWPSDERGAGKEFPGYKSDKWQKTTLWLDPVATKCFGYKNDHEGVRSGSWVRVGTPAPRSKRRKRKKPLQIGNLGHILFAHKERFHILLDEKRVLTMELAKLEEYDDETDSTYVPIEKHAVFDEISAEVERLDAEINPIWADIVRTEAEMRYRVRKMFPKPAGIVPKRVLRVLKRQP